MLWNMDDICNIVYQDSTVPTIFNKHKSYICKTLYWFSLAVNLRIQNSRLVFTVPADVLAIT